LKNILCREHSEMNHTAKKKNWEVSERLPCVDSWSKALSTLNSFLIPTDLTAIFSCSTVTSDLVFKLLVWTNGRTRQKTLILPEFWPNSGSQILRNSSAKNCQLELKTVPFRSMSLLSASLRLRSRCRCLDRRVEISSETTWDWINSIRSQCKVTITRQATHSM
jgi:hypothetical protein